MNSETPLRIAHVNVHCKVFDDEAVVLDMSTGTYFSLRGSAVEIWELAEANGTPATIAGGLAERYDAPSDVLVAATRGVVADLLDAGLLVSDADLAPASPAPAGPAPRAFVAPEIERFTDMQDMLMLDPIHEVDPTGWPHQLDGA